MPGESKLIKLVYTLSPVAVFMLLFGGMEWGIKFFDIPSWLIAAPSATIKSMAENWGEILPNLLVTLREILIGYGAGVSLGIILALIFTSNSFLDKAVSPYVIFLIVTPQMIIVPLLMLWMGFDIKVKIMAVALSSFPINMMSTMTGIRSVAPERYELMRSLRATKLQTFFKVLIPSALPNVFTGMRLATIFATTSAVGAELIGGNTGVGPRISYYTEFMMVEIAFAYVYIMIAIGVCFYTLIHLMELYVVKRRN